MKTGTRLTHKITSGISLAALLLWSVATDPCLGETSCCCAPGEDSVVGVENSPAPSSCCASKQQMVVDAAPASDDKSSGARLCSCERGLPFGLELERENSATTPNAALTDLSPKPAESIENACVSIRSRHITRTPPARGPPHASSLS